MGWCAEDRKRTLDTLLTNIENHKNHLSTGFVGTPYICHALSENGAHDMAATLFVKEDHPSWLYAVNMGATTVWERWDSVKPDGTFDESGMNSLNHALWKAFHNLCVAAFMMISFQTNSGNSGVVTNFPSVPR